MTSSIVEGTVRYLENTLGVKQAGYRDTIRVRAPDDSEASFFGVPADGRVPILSAMRTAFAGDGQTIRVTMTVYPADRTLFEIKAGLLPNTPPSAELAELTGGATQSDGAPRKRWMSGRDNPGSNAPGSGVTSGKVVY